MGDIVNRLRSLADCDARSGEPLGKVMREAADEIVSLKEALSDLLTWFPDDASPSEWRIKAGEYGADDAIEAARALFKEEE